MTPDTRARTPHPPGGPPAADTSRRRDGRARLRKITGAGPGEGPAPCGPPRVARRVVLAAALLGLGALLAGCAPDTGPSRQGPEGKTRRGRTSPHRVEASPKVQDGEALRGKVTRVIDGDTVEVLVERRPLRVRLHGVDCPEKGQAFGTRAKQETSRLCFGLDVVVVPRDRDAYGRTVADVVLPDGRVLNRELVRAGMAVWYRKYADDPELERLEREARAARRGLWSQANPEAPAAWRKAHGIGRAAKPPR
ncbi:MAG: thermonuclease family protein [Acidobacteria bacterium]|nr:thermonuclease family protein [Acidobacteriota bacterium]